MTSLIAVLSVNHMSAISYNICPVYTVRENLSDDSIAFQ